MGIGVKGYVYRGWQVRYTWSAAKGCNTYTASNPERPGKVETFARPAEAERWIDAQEMGAPATAKVERPTQRNRYGQRCARCGQWCNPGHGALLTWDEAERLGEWTGHSITLSPAIAPNGKDTIKITGGTNGE